MLRTPSEIHVNVINLCKKINPVESPLYVNVLPESYAKKDECFLNVQEKIKRDKGSILHGWCIWELPGIFIEGEFHAVWRSPENELVDITPKKDGERKILFLPDPTQIFDENAFDRRDNIRLAIRDHTAVHDFIKLSTELHAYQESCSDPITPRQFTMDPLIYNQYVEKKNAAAMRMLSLKPGRNDPCTCGSAKKFKKCCGKI